MKLLLRIQIIVFTLLFSTSAKSQLESSNWHFGPTSKGLHFSPTGVVTVTNNSYTPYNNEGCSVLSDPFTGALQFYTEGSKVIDADHLLMPNGSGLLSLPSSEGTGKIAADPGNCNRYYVFHNTSAMEVGSATKKLYYSIVDMTLPGNGTAAAPKGDVVPGLKNILVTSNVWEGMEIIPVSNSHDLWILSTCVSPSSVSVFKLTATGVSFINTYPLMSALQDIRPIVYCKANNKIAVGSCNDMDNTLLLNFNPATGVVTSQSTIPGVNGSNGFHYGIYSMAWSMDGTKLYISKYRHTNSGGKLYQYNLTTSTTQLIYNVHASSTTYMARGLKMGPDGKIYFLYFTPSGTVIGGINNPNNPGAACGFNPAQINMGSDLLGAHKFPDFLYSNNTMVTNADTIVTITKPCLSSSDTSFFSINKPLTDTDGDAISYQILGSTHLNSNAIFTSPSTIQYITSGPFPFIDTLTVRYCDNNCLSRCRTFNIFVNFSVTSSSSLTLPSDITLCGGSSQLIDAGTQWTNYLWSTGDTTQSITVQNSGSYYVTVKDNNNCFYSDSISIAFHAPPNLNIGNDTAVCEDITLDVQQPFTQILWNTGQTSQTNTVSSSGLYYVNITDMNGCSAVDSIYIFVSDSSINISGQSNICFGQSTTLTAIGIGPFIWSGGTSATTNSVTVSPTVSTAFFVSTSNACGNITDTINVQVESPTNITTSGDDSICAGQSVNLIASGSITYQWSGGAISSSSSITENPLLTTTYYVSGDSTSCGIDTDTIMIFVEPIPNVSVSGITTICAGQSTTLTAAGGAPYLWSDAASSTTPSIVVNPMVSTTYFVTNTTLNCGSDTDSILVNVENLVQLNISSSNDSICTGESVNLTASGSSSYQWSGGSSSTSGTISVSPDLTTTYYVAGTTNTCGSDTDTLLVVVLNYPTLNTSGLTGLCTGQSTTLSVTGANTYQWSGGSTSTSSSITVIPSISTDYIVTGYNYFCSSFDTIHVTVDDVPSLTLSGDNLICEGEQVTLLASGASSYLWSGAPVPDSDSSITVSPLINTTYTVIGVNGGCMSIPNSFAITVNPKPISSINGTSLICSGSTASYSSVVTSGSSPYNYLWSTMDTTMNTNFTSQNTVLSVIVNDANGCSDTAYMTIQIAPDPITTLPNGYSGCAPLNVNFQVTSNAISYLWNFGDGQTSSLQFPSHNYNIPGSYTTSLITSNSAGCSDTITSNSYINVYPSPIARIFSTGNVSSENPILTVYDSSFQGTNCVLNFGDGSSFNGCNWNVATHEYENEGEYTITQIVINSNGCSDTAEINIDATFESTFFVPNAFTPNGNGNNDEFFIYAVGIKKFHLMIFDRWGEKIFESNDIMNGWDGTYKGKLVQQGVYVWKVDYQTKRGPKKQQIGHVTLLTD